MLCFDSAHCGESGMSLYHYDLLCMYLFRVKDCTAMYHDEATEGLINAARLALLAKYPDYLEKGFDCLYTKPPVIYISEASQPGLSQTLSRGVC